MNDCSQSGMYCPCLVDLNIAIWAFNRDLSLSWVMFRRECEWTTYRLSSCIHQISGFWSVFSHFASFPKGNQRGDRYGVHFSGSPILTHAIGSYCGKNPREAMVPLPFRSKEHGSKPRWRGQKKAPNDTQPCWRHILYSVLPP